MNLFYNILLLCVIKHGANGLDIVLIRQSLSIKSAVAGLASPLSKRRTRQDHLLLLSLLLSFVM